jgi:hypothetical protein
MNILSDEDLKTYMSYNQMYVTKTICNSDFKTLFNAHFVYKIDNVVIDWFGDNHVCVQIYSDGNEHRFYRTGSRLALYAEIKHLFIPISEMYEAWKLS